MLGWLGFIKMIELAKEYDHTDMSKEASISIAEERK